MMREAVMEVDLLPSKAQLFYYRRPAEIVPEIIEATP